jgi:hypothetical protein
MVFRHLLVFHLLSVYQTLVFWYFYQNLVGLIYLVCRLLKKKALIEIPQHAP